MSNYPCTNPECDRGLVWRQVGVGENYEASDCPACGGFPTNPLAPCPNHVETPGQNCPTCGF